MERALEEHPGIRLVILDTLQKVRIESGSGMSYAADYRDASALKSVADRYHICLLAIHHLRKLPDEDPFNRLSGTNGLSGAADGSLVLLRTKRQEYTAVLSATGRDIEGQEETLEFDDCRWNRTTDPEQLQFGLLVMLLQKLLRRMRFKALQLSWPTGWGRKGCSLGRHSFPDISKAGGGSWQKRGSNWKRAVPTAKGPCGSGLVTEVTVVTVFPEKGQQQICCHCRHQRHRLHDGRRAG